LCFIVSFFSLVPHCFFVVPLFNFAKFAFCAFINFLFAIFCLCFILYPRWVFLQLLASFSLKNIGMQYTSFMTSRTYCRPICFAKSPFDRRHSCPLTEFWSVYCGGERACCCSLDFGRLEDVCCAQRARRHSLIEEFTTSGRSFGWHRFGPQPGAKESTKHTCSSERNTPKTSLLFQRPIYRKDQ